MAKKPKPPSSIFGVRTKCSLRDRFTIAWRVIRYGYILSDISVTMESRTERWVPAWTYLRKYNP